MTSSWTDSVPSATNQQLARASAPLLGQRCAERHPTAAYGAISFGVLLVTSAFLSLGGMPPATV